MEQKQYADYVKLILKSRHQKMTACVESYGCQLNFADGEKIKTLLADMGFELTDERDAADLIIFNTCAVRKSAEDKIFGKIGWIKNLKKNRSDLIFGLCGCMANEKHVIDKIKKTYSFVDLVFGTSSIGRLPELLHEVLSGGRHAYYQDFENVIQDEIQVSIRDSKYKASVPIMYGCNNFCTYCIVPYVRGRERSREIDAIIAEVKMLADSGYKEIMLLGQNVNSYGRDLGKNHGFAELLRRLNTIEGDFIIRFMSPHPKDMTKDVVDAVMECDKAAKHLHLPLQSGSNEILKAMNRGYTSEKYLETVEYIRSLSSDFSITTDIIVGFPNETHAQFEQTIEMMRKVKYDNIYSFIYSKREGTKAALLEDGVSYEEKSIRMRRLLEIQREIAVENYKRFNGRIMRVLPEKFNDGILQGKSCEFIIVEFKGDENLIGKFTDVKITETRNWAVSGELI